MIHNANCDDPVKLRFAKASIGRAEGAARDIHAVHSQNAARSTRIRPAAAPVQVAAEAKPEPLSLGPTLRRHPAQNLTAPGNTSSSQRRSPKGQHNQIGFYDRRTVGDHRRRQVTV
jgi:hypothetical protein